MADRAMHDVPIPMPWQHMCATSIAIFPSVGYYLFQLGLGDFSRTNAHNCHWDVQLELLARLIPLCIALRCWLLPQFWNSCGGDKGWSGVKHDARAFVYVAAWWIPLILIHVVLLDEGLRNLFNHSEAVKDWPSGCGDQRPFHGLLLTRFWALAAGHWLETSVVINTRRLYDSKVKAAPASNIVASSEGSPLPRPLSSSFVNLQTTEAAWPVLLTLGFGPATVIAMSAFNPSCGDAGRLVAFLVIGLTAELAKAVLRKSGPYRYWCVTDGPVTLPRYTCDLPCEHCVFEPR
jgi:hypothetical protein